MKNGNLRVEPLKGMNESTETFWHVTSLDARYPIKIFTEKKDCQWECA